MRRGTLPSHDPAENRTLGWQVLEWCDYYMRQPDGPKAGEPFVFSDEQVSFLLWFYAIDDTGRFLYQSGVLRRPKGWGKSPFLSAMALVELLGPCRFGGWSATGNPVAVPHPLPWVQLAAVSEAQTTNVMAPILAMLTESPAIDDYQVDPKSSRILVGLGGAGGRLVPVTAGSRSLEGARPSFVVMDETHHWVSANGGHHMAEVIRRNLGKSRDGSGRSIEATNAHAPGEDSVAERSFEAMLAQVESKTRTAGLLYDSSEAPPDTDLADEENLRAGLSIAYGDSASWIDLDRVVNEVWDPRTPTDVARRFYLNQVVAASDSWASPMDIDACTDHGAMPPRGATIAIGFDGSKNDDATALVGATVDGETVFEIEVWEKPEGPEGEGWEVPRDRVDDMVAHVFANYHVAAFYADLHPWQSYVDKWAETYGDGLTAKASGLRHPIAFDMRSRTKDATLAAEAFLAETEERRLIVVGETLNRHLKNAKRWPNQWGVSFGKESRESKRKVDAAWAAVLARAARAAAIAKGVEEPYVATPIVFL